ncbi:MAG: OsmC family protein [Myxococcota bacterium]
MSDSESVRTAFQRAVNLLTIRPAKGQRTYVSTATLTDGVLCRVEEKGHVTVSDLPQAMGGSDKGPSPSALLRAALGSCTAIGIKMWAARRDVPVRLIEVAVETDVDARGQFGMADHITPGFEAIRLAIRVCSPASRETIEGIVSASLRYSPLMEVFSQSQRVETRLTLETGDAQ